ncbi:MAG: radical SAM protein [Candidatus Syntrophosphaera sp.]
MKKKHLIYPVFLPLAGCPSRCVYCDQFKVTGASRFDLEDTLAGIASFISRNPGREKQVAFYGGSFTALPEDFRKELMHKVRSVSDDITSFRISTHPLFVGDDILDWCRQAAISTIELGIQDFCTRVLGQTGRGYTAKEAMEAAIRVKHKGFELGVQLMPGLPGWNDASLKTNHRALESLEPDLLRLYPLIVIRGTPLEEIYRKGEYIPLTLEQAVAQCADYFPLAGAHGIKIIKLGIPSNLKTEDVVAGPWHPAFGESVKKELLSRKTDFCPSGKQSLTIWLTIC